MREHLSNLLCTPVHADNLLIKNQGTEWWEGKPPSKTMMQSPRDAHS